MADWRCTRSPAQTARGGKPPIQATGGGSLARQLMLQDVLQKKIVRPERRRELVRYLEWTYRVSERRGCAALRFDRSSHRYRAIRNWPDPG